MSEELVTWVFGCGQALNSPLRRILMQIRRDALTPGDQLRASTSSLAMHWSLGPSSVNPLCRVPVRRPSTAS